MRARVPAGVDVGAGSQIQAAVPGRRQGLPDARDAAQPDPGQAAPARAGAEEDDLSIVNKGGRSRLLT